MIAIDLARAAAIATVRLQAAVDALSVGWVYAAAFCSATPAIATVIPPDGQNGTGMTRDERPSHL
jgi:hypothetical protein